MRPGFARRKTARKTAQRKIKKTAVKNWQSGKIVVIREGALAGRIAKIVRAARGGVIASVAEPFFKKARPKRRNSNGDKA
ncbi:MAG: hypothetical protein PHD95_07130 [Candidatus ainarchaeum sp.]|nr:hypothetical protein [Candidatus ainarchaeum sp.]